MAADQLRIVHDKINDAAKDGNYLLTYYDTLSKVTIDTLREQGYNVDVITDLRNEIDYLISW
jgi:hypothetical protein